MKKILFIIGFLGAIFSANAQIGQNPTTFNYGIRLPNVANEVATDSIPVIDGEGVVQGFITKPQLAQQLAADIDLQSAADNGNTIGDLEFETGGGYLLNSNAGIIWNTGGDAMRVGYQGSSYRGLQFRDQDASNAGVALSSGTRMSGSPAENGNEFPVLDQVQDSVSSLENYVEDFFLPVNKSIVSHPPGYTDLINNIQGAGLFWQGPTTPDSPSGNSGMVLTGSNPAGTAIPKLFLGATPDNLWYQPQVGQPFYHMSSRFYVYEALNSSKKISLQYNASETVNNVSLDNDSTDPSVVVDGNGDIYIGGVDNQGWATITVIRRDGTNVTRRLVKLNTVFDEPTDTHNSPAILYDDRPGAEYPLIIFQNNHSQDTITRYWRFPSLRIEDEPIPAMQTIPNGSTTADQVTYNMVYRYNDEIYVFNRIEGTSPDTYVTWRLCYSSNNGASWVQRGIFNSAASTSHMYLFCSQIDNTSLINIGVAASGSGSEKKAMYMQLDMSTGELTNLTSTIVPDVRTYITGSSETIDPFVSGITLMDPPAGERAASPLISTNETGDLVALIHHIYPSSQTLDIVKFDRSTGAIVNSEVVNTADTDFSYNNKMLMYNDDRKEVYAFKWKELYKDNTTRTMYGNSILEQIDITDVLTPVTTEYMTSNNKIDRGKKLSDYSGFVFTETAWESDPTYIDFDGSLYIEKFDKNDTGYGLQNEVLGTYTATQLNSAIGFVQAYTVTGVQPGDAVMLLNGIPDDEVGGFRADAYVTGIDEVTLYIKCVGTSYTEDYIAEIKILK